MGASKTYLTITHLDPNDHTQDTKLYEKLIDSSDTVRPPWNVGEDQQVRSGLSQLRHLSAKPDGQTVPSRNEDPVRTRAYGILVVAEPGRQGSSGQGSGVAGAAAQQPAGEHQAGRERQVGHAGDAQPDEH